MTVSQMHTEELIPDLLKRQKLLAYVDDEIPKITKEYDKFWEIEDPEDNPYKSKYKARKLLEDALKEVGELMKEISDANCEENAEGGEMIARLLLYIGKNYYFCEEVPSAERFFLRSLERYLKSTLRLAPKSFVHIQDLFNQMGMLWCNRHNHAEGMNFLRRAQIMYLNRPQAVKDTCEDQAENNYTLTMFYLAQAYGGLKKPGLSARFCAETMSRQLQHNIGERPKEVIERDPFDCKDWVRNCCSLSDYFANECMFWTGEYLLHSAAVMCERCLDICGIQPEGLDELTAEVARDLGTLYSSRLKFAKTCTEHPVLCEEGWRGERKPKLPADTDDDEGGIASGLTFKCAADQGKAKAAEGGTGPIKWDEVFPEVVYLEDEEAEDNRLAEETMAIGQFQPKARVMTVGSGAAAAAISWLELGTDDKVRLPVHFGPLHAVVERRMKRANAAFVQFRGRPALIEDLVETEAEQEEEASTDLKGRRLPSCAGITFEAVREIFKLANHYFMRSLSHFLLDGWVTEHVRILQELSLMYRTLIFWEKNPKRAAAMMARRQQMLAPLLEHLNPKAFVAYYRQLSFEMGECMQEFFELKAEGKFPGTGWTSPLDEDDEASTETSPAKLARCNELAKSSIKYYETFIATYNDRDGKIPNKVEDDDTRVYLTARLNTARLSTKMKGLSVDDQLDWHKKALKEYEWILDYGSRHDVSTKPSIGMATEMRLCEEMAGMLPAKLSKIAARRR